MRPNVFALAVVALSACEPQSAVVEAPLRVNGTVCMTGALPADFTGLIENVPADRPLRVQSDDGGPATVTAAFDAESTDPSFSILRTPFPADDATVVPLRILLTIAETVTGLLMLTPDAGSACEIVLSASAG
jgi:hypothetical protein